MVTIIVLFETLYLFIGCGLQFSRKECRICSIDSCRVSYIFSPCSLSSKKAVETLEQLYLAIFYPHILFQMPLMVNLYYPQPPNSMVFGGEEK